MTHSGGGSYAVMPEPVHMHRGTTVPGLVTDEAHSNPSRGFAGGYNLETLALGLPFLSAFLEPGPRGWGRNVSSALEKYKYIAGVWICGEDMAREQNAVTLHKTEKDQYGLPASVVSRSPHENDVKMVKHAHRSMKNIFEAMGSNEVYHLAPYPASHNMGTNRMSEKAADGVVNKHGQSHDIKNLFVSDGSQFTSSGSENPTLTIVALAIRQAEFVAESMKKGEI